MKIEHIAIWTADIEKMKEYYIKFYGATANDVYINTSNGFNSYFLTFASGARLELMYRPDIVDNASDTIAQYKGIIHIAFAVETKAEVDAKAKELTENGYTILRGPRTSGDGYYEFETIDPENNRLEIITQSADK